MRQISYIVNRLSTMSIRFATWGLVVCGVIMSVTILLQIIFRFVVYVPFPWSEELARYLMVWMGMLGSVVALRKGRHIGVTIFIEKLPSALYRSVLSLVQLVLIVFLAILLKEAWEFAVFNIDQASPAMGIPMFYPYVAVFVGAVLMIIELIADILQDYFPTSAGTHREIVAKIF